MKTLNDAIMARGLYAEIKDAQGSLDDIEKEESFVLICRDKWARMPINSEVAKPMLRNYYRLKIETAKEKLKDLGFDPNATGT